MIFNDERKNMTVIFFIGNENIDTWEKLVDLVSSGRCRSEW